MNIDEMLLYILSLHPLLSFLPHLIVCCWLVVEYAD